MRVLLMASQVVVRRLTEHTIEDGATRVEHVAMSAHSDGVPVTVALYDKVDIAGQLPVKQVTV